MPTGINGAHVLLYSNNPEADRAFFRDILNFPAVDAGGGWLIFALPPAEVGPLLLRALRRLASICLIVAIFFS